MITVVRYCAYLYIVFCFLVSAATGVGQERAKKARLRFFAVVNPVTYTDVDQKTHDLIPGTIWEVRLRDETRTHIRKVSTDGPNFNTGPEKEGWLAGAGLGFSDSDAIIPLDKHIDRLTELRNLTPGDTDTLSKLALAFWAKSVEATRLNEDDLVFVHETVSAMSCAIVAEPQNPKWYLMRAEYRRSLAGEEKADFQRRLKGAVRSGLAGYWDGFCGVVFRHPKVSRIRGSFAYFAHAHAAFPLVTFLPRPLCSPG